VPDIFISYSRDDQATARRFAEGFEREGFSVWWDQALDPGDAYDHVTEKALKEAKAVAVLWSTKSVESRWVRAEATLANRNQTLLPAMIEACERPIMFELTHTVDLSHWRGDPKDREWQTYIAGVRKFVQKDAPATLTPARPVVGRAKKVSSTAITVAVATLVVAGVLLWALNRAPGSAAKLATDSAATPAAPAEVTLAVLPFADMSQAHDQEYFSDGLSEEILNEVAQIEGLRVTARTSSFSFKGKNEDMRVIGEKLGVANLLEGSIRKDGNDVRITAQLINAKDGTHIWSQTYDREMSKIFALQERIAKDVAQALSIKLDVGETSRAKGGTTNLEAYDKYLHAIAANGKGDFKDAHNYFGEATELDPGFVNAWMGDFVILNTAPVLSFEESSEKKKMILSRVEAQARDSWQALYMRAAIGDFSKSFLQQKADYEAAYAAADREKSKRGRKMISPFDAHRRRKVGDISGAQRLWEPLARANPTFFAMPYWQLRHLFDLGHSAAGLAELDRLRALPGYQGGSDTDHHQELILELRFRENTDAATIWARYSELVKRDPLLQKLYAKRNDAKGASLALHQAFEAPDGPQKARSEVIALWSDYFGDKDLALAAIRRGLLVSPYDGFQMPTVWYPYVTGLRGDPRFKAIARDQGYADYWRKSGEWGDFCKPVGTDDFECH
jgi:TolB-like protein